MKFITCINDKIMLKYLRNAMIMSSILYNNLLKRVIVIS